MLSDLDSFIAARILNVSHFGFRPWQVQTFPVPSCTAFLKTILNERLTTLARVHNLRFVKLHLDGDHVDVVLVFEELRGGLEDLLGVAGLRRGVDREVHGDGVLVRGQGPDAEVVHQDDVEQVHEVGHDVVEAHRPGAALHEDAHRVADHVGRGAEDDEGEDDGADGIGHLEAGVDVDQDGGDEHADRLDEVAEDVDHGRPDVEVLRRRGVLVVAIAAALHAAVVVVVEVTVGATVTVAASAVTVTVGHAVEDEPEDDIEEDGAARDHHHWDRIHFEVARGDPVRRQIHQDAGHVPDDDYGEEGAEGLGAVKTERVLLAAGSAMRLSLSLLYPLA